MASFGLGRTDAAAARNNNNDEPMEASTPWLASADGNLPVLQAALQTLQLPVTAQDENGYTLLQAAVSYNRAQIWQWLATQPAFTVHAVDAEGDSALHYAGTVAAAQFLVQSGIDVTKRNADNQTALEKKQEELQELRQDEDFEETDEEYVQLLGMVNFLSNLTNMSQ